MILKTIETYKLFNRHSHNHLIDLTVAIPFKKHLKTFVKNSNCTNGNHFDLRNFEWET